MPLPANVKSLLQARSHTSHQHHMGELKGHIASSNNIVRHSAARMVDEPSPQQARAIDKVLRLPK